MFLPEGLLGKEQRFGLRLEKHPGGEALPPQVISVIKTDSNADGGPQRFPCLLSNTLLPLVFLLFLNQDEANTPARFSEINIFRLRVTVAETSPRVS